MLYIVLALVVAAFGLLIAALTTANTLWAWISVVVSVVAAALLVADWRSGRRAARSKDSARPTVVTVGGRRTGGPEDPPAEREYADTGYPGTDPDTGDFDSGDSGDLGTGDLDGEDRGTGSEEPPAEAARRSDAEATTHLEPVVADESGDPAEEPTDASDLLVVAGLDAEVRVVDEHPRYHLATCGWLGPRRTIAIAVSEARQLGFTPCARCGPDAVLAARHRATR